jgi:prepilin signal peptidase PulO-like enzyme (type II secretory pathway)
MTMLGVAIGTQVNRAIYRLAWCPRQIGPWSARHPDAPPRTSRDRIPIIGWWFLRREASIHGSAFWVRPMLIELATGLLFAAVYWYETVRLGPTGGFDPGTSTTHVQCFTHLLLFALMLVATFIDFDEQTIPDAITMPGTMLGLTIAALWPDARPVVQVPAAIAYAWDFLHVGSGTASPVSRGWPPWLDGPRGLAIGLACFWAWCVALAPPATWTTRRGWWKAVQFAWASLCRHPATIFLAFVAAAGAIGIATIWFLGQTRWESLLSALVGMAVGGGTIWAVRIVGTHALGQEAMGFGDVTLMAMIGAFTGWQPTLIIFFPSGLIFASRRPFGFCIPVRCGRSTECQFSRWVGGFRGSERPA